MSRKHLVRGLHCRLFATVSMLAVLASGPALAERVSEPSGYWMSAEGGYLFAEGTAQPLLKPGTGTPAQSDRVRDAWAFQVAVGGPVGKELPGWDFRLAYTGIRANSHHRSATGSSGGVIDLPDGSSLSLTDPPTFSSSIRQGFDIGDFDVGRSVGLGALSTRAFAGARIVSFNQSSRASLLGGEGAVELSCSHYFGGGPRVGASGSYPLGELAGATVSLTGGVAGDVLFGRSYHKATVTSSGTATPVTLDEKTANKQTQTAFNADASIGLALAFPLGASECLVTAGYRGEGWWGIVNTKVQAYTLAGSGGTSSGDQYFHGPFVNLALKW
jgi:hypothetical protein